MLKKQDNIVLSPARKSEGGIEESISVLPESEYFHEKWGAVGQPSHSEVNVRGKTYMVDDVKQPSGPYAFRLAASEAWLCNKLSHCFCLCKTFIFSI